MHCPVGSPFPFSLRCTSPSPSPIFCHLHVFIASSSIFLLRRYIKVWLTRIKDIQYNLISPHPITLLSINHHLEASRCIPARTLGGWRDKKIMNLKKIYCSSKQRIVLIFASLNRWGLLDFWDSDILNKAIIVNWVLMTIMFLVVLSPIIAITAWTLET